MLCLLVVAVVVAASASAHDIQPRSLVLRGLQKSATVTVEDCCGCSAVIGAASSRPDLFSVSPPSQTGTSVTFTVTSESYGQGVPHGLLVITINGIGLDFMGNPCDEVSTTPVPVVVAYEEVSSGTTGDAGTVSDPINTFAGEYYREEPVDLKLGGPMPLYFQRYYSSHLFREGDATSPMGQGWTHNFRWRLGKGATTAEVYSGRGRVIAFTRPDEESPWTLDRHVEVPYQLIDDATQTILVAPDGTRYTFNFFQTLSQIADGRGNTLFLSHSGARLNSVSDDLGRMLSFAYNEDDLLTSVSDGTRTVQFEYAAAALIGAVDAAGAETQYDYDTALPGFGALMTSAELPLGNRPYTQTYDAEGRVATQMDAYGGLYTLDYTVNATGITDPLNRGTRHAHSSDGKLEEYRDAEDRPIAMAYDAMGRRTEFVSRDNLAYGVDHGEADGNPRTLILPGGEESSVTYAERVGPFGEILSDLASITMPDGSEKTFTHDTQGRLTAITHRDGSTSSWSYNTRGQIVQFTNLLGGVWTYSFDGAANLSLATDPFGNETAFDYDSHQRLSSVVAADGTSINYTYDARDRMTSMVDEDGGVWLYDYDGNGNLVATTDAAGATMALSYDLMDRLLGVETGDGAGAFRSYDALGRLDSFTDRNGQTSSLVYGAQDLATAITDPAGHVWSVTRTPEGAVQSQSDPLGNTSSFEYDGSGNLAAVVEPRGGAYRFVYDALLRPVQTTGPGGLDTAFSFDFRDAITSVTSAGAVENAYTRNGAGQWTAREDANGNLWQRGHDAMGRLVSQTDPRGNTLAYTYDNRNRMAQATLPGGVETLELTYNNRDLIAALDYTGGPNLVFAYDAVGRCTSTNGVVLGYDAQGAVVNSNGLEIARDPGGRIASITYEPGKTVTYTYDSRNLLTQVADWLGGTTTFTYDAARRRTQTTHANGVVTTHEYDADGNVAGVVERLGGETLSEIALVRNLGGRITAATRDVPLPAVLPLSEESFAVDEASQLQGATYDALGRMQQQGDVGFTWDLAGRLLSYSGPGGTAQLTCDGFGQRLTVQRNAGPERSYIWNYALDFPRTAMVREDGQTVRYDVWEPNGNLLYTVDEAGRHSHHFDEMGNTLFTTDAAGAVAARFAYDPYGRLLAQEGTAPSPYTYGGQFGVRREGDAGLYEMGARYYDAQHGRFLSRDLKYAGHSPLETNPYAFARANPLLFLDPLGTNARVNGTGDHSDISVDVWDGDKIVGIYTVSFSARAWSASCNGVTDALWGVGQVALGFVPGVGAEGQLNGDFTLKGGIGDTSSSGKLVVPGGVPQDTQLAMALFKAQGIAVLDGESPVEVLRRIMAQQPAGLRDYSTSCKTLKFVTDSEYGRYKIYSQVCNDFTDDMLDIYFGYNWYWGSLYTADGVVEALTDHLESKRRAADAARQSRNPATARFLNALPSLSWLSPI